MSLRLLPLLFLLVSRTFAGEPPATLPGTQPLELSEPLDVVMVDGIDRFCLQEIEKSVERRQQHWKRDYSSAEAYAKSIEPNRERLRRYLGVVDERVKPTNAGYVRPSIRLDFGENVVVHSTRWRVLPGVTAAALRIFGFHEDVKRRRHHVLLLPDSSWQTAAGEAAGEPARTLWIAGRLVREGYSVSILMTLGRDTTFSGNPDVAMTNQSHREWVYRPAFQMGRHVSGYEIQKVSSFVDLFHGGVEGRDPVTVFGIGDGGQLALYAAACDPRIEACVVSGYFEPREEVWREPIDRNVWRLLDEFGDAEIGSLIAPRPLIIEASTIPEMDGPADVEKGRRGGAAPGRIRAPSVERVRAEYDRLRPHYTRLDAGDRLALVARDDEALPPGDDATFANLHRVLGGGEGVIDNSRIPRRSFTWPKDLVRQQVSELVDHTQMLMENSDRVRYEFWKNADRGRSKSFTPEEWEEFAEEYREYVHDEMIGRLPEPTMPMNSRSRMVIDEPTHAGYEVVLDVYPDVIAGGILLLPKGLEPGERRPVVVCQHGLEGIPMDTITTDESTRAWRAYKGYATQLVKRGFVVYAPQNPYRGGDRFRTLQRKSNPLGRSLFSYIVRQHERTLEWLAEQPFVDADRIGFYGLSYGGKTAMRVPALLPPRTNEDGTRKPGYCLSICSADFNEWIRKCVTNKAPYSYVFTGEYEMFEWNMGHVANYAELASLISPRPFMVERGHDDGVAPDEWVAWEYAKVRRHYAKLGIPDRTQIEWFDGPHTINGKGTFAFLHRHLDWPAP